MVEFPLGRNGTLLAALFVHSSRVRLLEEVKKSDIVEDKPVLKTPLFMDSASEPVLVKRHPTTPKNNRLLPVAKVLERQDENDS